MGKMVLDRSQSTLVDAFLRDEMARGNRALRSLAPVIAHLLEADGPNLVSDAIVARVRGMVSHIASQICDQFTSQDADNARSSDWQKTLANLLATDEPLIDHLYALALEGVLTQSLSTSTSIDPVLSPLLQELIAAHNTEIAQLAISALAAQSRFVLGQERMEIALRELPHELLSRVLDHFAAIDSGLSVAKLDEAAAKLKIGIDEGEGRVALFARLASSMQGGAVAALDLDHAGFALFASSAATLTGQTRERVVFACHEGQGVRLALILKAAGADNGLIDKQIALFSSGSSLPSGFDDMSMARAIDALREMGAV